MQVAERTPRETGLSTMRAVTQRAYGSAEVLAVKTVDRPTVAADEVLVEVVAAGLDRGVWHLMTGLPYLIRIMGFGFRRPKNPVPGADVAGRVAAIGDDVTRFAVGDEVFGIADGSFAEFARAKESKLIHKPRNISFEMAGVSTISGMTALQALTTVGRVAAGDHVLVIGASGGVGSFAVQLAKAFGATVTGVASGPKLEMVRSLGADRLIDYQAGDPVDGAIRYDAIIDIGGRNPLAKLQRALTSDGTLVIVGGEGADVVTGGIGRQLRAAALSPFVSQRLTFFVASEDHGGLEDLLDLVADGHVKPSIDRAYRLCQVPDALADLASGRIAGKAVIDIQRPADSDHEEARS